MNPILKKLETGNWKLGFTISDFQFPVSSFSQFLTNCFPILAKLKEFASFVFQNSSSNTQSAVDFPRSNINKIPFRWIIAGVLLIVLFSILYFLSNDFAKAVPLQNRPILSMTAVLLLAGLAFMFISELVRHSQTSRKLMIWILATGAIMRGFMMVSTVILEVDYHRYLWDGAVTANGFNPYQFSPDEIVAAVKSPADFPNGNKIPSELIALAKEPGATIFDINHSYLRTIYPPITQAAYALAYFINPWGLYAWRFVLLIVDLLTLVLLFSILRYLNLSPLWISIYWLNPLLIKESFNSGHMDLLIFPFLLAAFIFLFRQKPYWAATFLALAIGVKIWPLILLPVFLRQLIPDYKKILGVLTLLGSICFVLFLPIVITGVDESSGFNAYGNRWQLNDAAFKIFLGISYVFLKITGQPTWEAYALARKIVLLVSAGWIIYITLQKTDEPRRIVDQCLIIIAAIYLISPTQFPWYVVWLIPFLALNPRRPLLLLTAMLPIYYFRYYFEAIGRVELFDYFIVWLEFGPVWFYIFYEWRNNRRLNGPATFLISKPSLILKRLKEKG